MENIAFDAAVGGYSSPAFAHVAIAELEVFERAVIRRGTGGVLCPQRGWANTRPQMTFTPAVSLQSGFGQMSADLGNVRVFKPRTGSHAISGTG